MQISQPVAHEVESARVLLVLAAVGIVAFWRVILRILLAIIAIAIIVVVGAAALGLVAMMQR